MRKMLMMILLAGTAAPVFAQFHEGRDRGEERSARAERRADADTSEAPRPREVVREQVQPAAPARAANTRPSWNGAGRTADPADAARWQERRAQAIANGDQGQRRWGDRGPAAAVPQGWTPPPAGVAPVVATPRQGWTGNGRWTNREGVATATTVGRGGRDDHWDGDRNGRWQGRDERHDDRRVAEDRRRWDGDRDGRWDDRNGHRWSNDWRRDSRYDWQRYRNENRFVFRLGTFYDPFGYGYRPLNVGFSLYSGYYQRNFWIDDPYQYRLPPAYGPYRWVRYYNDAVLVDIYSGQVVDVIRGFFW